jgi:RNA polymerase Rpb5, N-terminal domain
MYVANQLQTLQGYEVSDEELNLDYDEFRSKYSDAMGGPEYVLLRKTSTKSVKSNVHDYLAEAK